MSAFDASSHSSKISFSIRGKGGSLTSLLNWIEGYILTDSFDADIKARFGSSGKRANLRKQVRELIEVLIYQAYPDPGGRTNDLKRSFDVVSGTPKDPDACALTVFSDVDVATAKSGSSKGEFSYAGFFERPVDFSSFIKAESPLDPKRYRPFMEELTKLVQQETENLAIQVVAAALKKRMPGVRGKSK